MLDAGRCTCQLGRSLEQICKVKATVWGGLRSGSLCIEAGFLARALFPDRQKPLSACGQNHRRFGLARYVRSMSDQASSHEFCLLPTGPVIVQTDPV